MKRKINITSKMVKRTCLIVIGVAVFVLLLVVTIQSFNRGHVLSNSTPLNGSELSGEYLEYVDAHSTVDATTGEKNRPQPTGYAYSVNENNNNAVKSEFSSEKTQTANTIEVGGSAIEQDNNGTGNEVTIDGVKYHYSGKSGSLVYTANVKEDGFYNLLLEYMPSTTEVYPEGEESGGANIERKILIDGEVPYEDLSNVAFQRVWADGGEKLVDLAGNEIKPKQVEKPAKRASYVYDQVGYVTEPYMIYFTRGEHDITIESIRENMLIANVYVTSVESYMTYDEYQQKYQDKAKVTGKISYQIQGEGGNEADGRFTNVTRSSSTIYAVSDRTSSYNVTIGEDGKKLKSSPVKLVLNTIGGAKWSSPGDWIRWDVEVEEEGLYEISLRCKQNVSRGLFSTRKLYIDDEIPFTEAQNCKFVYKSNWSIVTLGNEKEPFLFYLSKGTHTLTLECTLGDYATQISRVQDTIDDLNRLYRQIIQKTGISPDPYIDYFKGESGKKFIEEATAKFREARDTLLDVSKAITKISGEKSSETASLETMAVQLKQFADDHYKIQKNLSDFSTNISSLGTWILNVSQQALTIDYLMVHSADYKLPKANPNIFGSLWFGIKGFVLSFTYDYESVGLTAANSEWKNVDVWLLTSESQGREQANAISSMINEEKSNEDSRLNGINVTLKVVSPDVLLTATLAGRGPDVAINVANGTPVNYALRGATYNLATFTRQALDEYGFTNIPSFEEIALNEETRWFQQSAMVPYEFEGGYYALPYTQSFLVTFYRTDMFEEYGWEVPQTWDQVIDLIPELQNLNFQFYLPLNTVGSSSVVNQIFASKLYQSVDNARESAFYRTEINEFGSEYVESNFDSKEAMEAFEFWCSFYTDYSFPLQASFVNRFRSGETPIGIAGYDTYNTLAVSAPEIRGKWGFELLPGTIKTNEQGDEFIDHLGAASGTALIMMNQTEVPFEAWKFMQWFTSADTQAGYAREIEAILGSAARHNTANIEAFKRLAWTTEEQNLLLEQWNNTIGVPEVAGGYYTGRNLENAFRYVVNNNENPRQTLADYILTINSEIDRKREEFGLGTSTKAAKE